MGVAACAMRLGGPQCGCGGCSAKNEAYAGRTIGGGLHIPGGTEMPGSMLPLYVCLHCSAGAAGKVGVLVIHCLPHAPAHLPSCSPLAAPTPTSDAAGAATMYTVLGLLQLVAGLVAIIAPYRVSG